MRSDTIFVTLKTMDNQESLQQGIELPSPNGAEQHSAGAAEYAHASEQQQSGGPAQSVAGVTPLSNAHVQAIVGDPQAVAPTVAPSVQLSAADADLIEKEWVEKAKQIVAHTTGDPFMQNKEINKMKADYIKKRYNKDIKVVSE